MTSEPTLPDILQAMDIPLWLVKKPSPYLDFPLRVLNNPDNPKYCLWATHTSLKPANLEMLKRLTQALGWDFERCLLVDCKETPEKSDIIIKAMSALGIEKIILFGKEVSVLLGIPVPENSVIVDLSENLSANLSGNLSVAIVPSVEALMGEPAQKREAWTCLSPAFVNAK